MKQYDKQLNSVRKFAADTMMEARTSYRNLGYSKYDALNNAFHDTLFQVFGYCNKDGSNYDVRFADVMQILKDIEEAYASI